jgi:hypothetical protein
MFSDYSKKRWATTSLARKLFLMTMYHMKGRFSRGVWRNCGIKAVEILQPAAAPHCWWKFIAFLSAHVDGMQIIT